jgi:hypothetical protein
LAAVLIEEGMQPLAAAKLVGAWQALACEGRLAA